MEKKLNFKQYQVLLNILLKKIEGENNISLKRLHPLVLAYIGDAFFNLFVRIKLYDYKKYKVREMHTLSSKIVSATMQAYAYRKIELEFNQEEMNIIRRGRNTYSTVPKSATIIDYRYSTGFEALLGFLFLTNNQQRLETLCDKTFKIIFKKISESPNLKF